MQLKYSIVCLLVVAAVAVFASVASSSEGELAGGKTEKEGVRAGFSPAKLFDFKNYKIVFRKTYSSPLEEMVRAKYFLSRAFRAFVSAIEYKYRKSPYYLGVNQMSDWTPEEIDMSVNKVVEEDIDQDLELEADKQARGGSEDELPELLPNNVDEVKRELKKIADSSPPGSPGYDELKVVMGETAATPSSGTQSANVRDLPMEKLINSGTDVHLNAETARKVVRRVPSNNADYKPLELPSFGLWNHYEKVSFTKMKSGEPSLLENPAVFFSKALKSTFRALKIGNSKNDNEKLPDEVFLDLRETNCFTEPRYQGRCGSCYAFTAISIFEWMYCMKKGKLVEFSEQYMIDCGRKHFWYLLEGCHGGELRGAAKFIKNFGLELRANYPYIAQNGKCPYRRGINPKKTGFIRVNFKGAVKIPLYEAPKYLANGPLYVRVATGKIFHEYGGGVFGYGCNMHSTHGVVLVGHGRQDGEEYWLIRNSFGTDWGEGGYGKLAKKAGCIPSGSGWLFASSNGTVVADIKENELNDHQVVKSRQVQ